MIVVMQTTSWGILGAANIAKKRLVPALAKSRHCRAYAIASRDADRARQAADELGIPVSYGSYEELLADDNIDIIYNPLPNTMHVDWSIRALEAGKHVLCEKPIASTSDEVRRLLAARERSGKQVVEAFMVRFHPQWRRVTELLSEGRIGTLTAFHGHFSYMNTDASNIRNQSDVDGGALLDIGCYMVMFSRLVFGCEPASVQALVGRDPQFGTDRLTSALLEYPAGGEQPGGHATFTASTQQVPHQVVQLVGTSGRIEVDVPVNITDDMPGRIRVDDGSALDRSGVSIEEIAPADQFALQADAFAECVMGAAALEWPLEDAVANAAVIEAIFESAESGRRIRPAV